MSTEVRRQRRCHGVGIRGALLAGLLLLPAAGWFAACGEGGGGAGPAVYTEADNGRTVAAAVGDRITVRLSENPSTGYTWEPTYSSGLEPGDDEFVAPSTSPPVVGAAGTRTFTFVVTAAGTQSFAAVSVRPWEAGTGERAAEFTLTVEAR